MAKGLGYTNIDSEVTKPVGAWVVVGMFRRPRTVFLCSILLIRAFIMFYMSTST